jgi:hypothetical protein
MFKRGGRFDGQLRGFKSRERRALYCSDDFTLSSFFFLSPQPIGFSFFPSLSLSLSYREAARERAYQIYEKNNNNNNKSKSVARGRADALEPLELTRD